MCAIVDADVIRSGLFTNAGSAGDFFLSQVEDGKIKIVLGGQKLRDEYWGCGKHVRRWIAGATVAGLVRPVDDYRVNERATQLVGHERVRSNDWHVLALAQISGARLLYSYDGDLREDFKDKALIDKPRGKLYARSNGEEVAEKHRRLLRQRLCPS